MARRPFFVVEKEPLSSYKWVRTQELIGKDAANHIGVIGNVRLSVTPEEQKELNDARLATERYYRQSQWEQEEKARWRYYALMKEYYRRNWDERDERAVLRLRPTEKTMTRVFKRDPEAQ